MTKKETQKRKALVTKSGRWSQSKPRLGNRQVGQKRFIRRLKAKLGRLRWNVFKQRLARVGQVHKLRCSKKVTFHKHRIKGLRRWKALDRRVKFAKRKQFLAGQKKGRTFGPRRKPDIQVRLTRMKGRRIRRITKTGGRHVYRPPRKTRVARWWKTRADRRQKRRKYDKPRRLFRFILRARNDLELLSLRKKHRFSRAKRMSNYLTWKRKTPLTRQYHYHRDLQRSRLSNHNDLTISFRTPGVGLHRARLVGRMGVKSLRGTREIRQGRPVTSTSGTSLIDPWSGSNSIRASWQPSKRMRKYHRFVIHRQNSVSAKSLHGSVVQRSRNAWRSGVLTPKHSASARLNPRFNAFWKHGWKHR